MRRLFSLLLVIVMALSMVACGGTTAPAATEAPAADAPMQYITPEDAKALLEDDGYVFFDIRKTADSSVTTVPGAQAWDMDAAKEGDAEAGKATMTEATKDLDKQIILICYSGKRYAQAATNALAAIGYDMSKVWTLEGGFTAWSEKFPELCVAPGEAAAPAAEPYKIGIVTPTLTVSEDEFRGAEEMVAKYPDIVVHKTLPEDFATNVEGCISVVTSLADDPEMKYILFNNGMEGIVPAFQTIREKRPDITTIVTCNDDPNLLNEYVDLAINTDWNRRGVTIATKAYNMGAKTFIHYSFPTHMASASKATRRDMLKQTCEELGMEFVEIMTPDPQTGNGTAAMLQFLREDLPRQIEKYGKDTCIFGTNCPMYDVILDEAFKLGFIVSEQCCPTPTQAYPTVLNMELTAEDMSNYDKINALITEAAAEAGMTGRLSGWAMPSSVYVPQFQVELAVYMHDNGLTIDDVLSKEFLDEFSKTNMPVAADFAIAGEGLNHYWMLILEDIFY